MVATNTSKPLDPRHLVFIDKYIEHLFNGTRKPEKAAADELGISHAGLLRKPGVSEEINKRVNDYLSLADVDKVIVLNEIKKVAFSCITDVMDDNWDVKSVSRIKAENPEALDSIKSVKRNKNGELEIEMYSKMDGLKELASILNMKKTTVDVNHGVQKPGLFDDLEDEGEDEILGDATEAIVNAIVEDGPI